MPRRIREHKGRVACSNEFPSAPQSVARHWRTEKMEAPFRIIPSTGPKSFVLVEIPHAGTLMPKSCQPQCAASSRSLREDADLYVDELYEQVSVHGSDILAAKISRYVVDLNRAPEDIDCDAVTSGPASPKAPRGVIWRLTSSRKPALKRPLTRHEYENRIAAYYRPYHEALRDLVKDRLKRFGRALVLAAHSMPSHTLGTRRADIVPGTLGRTSASAEYIDCVDHYFREKGLSVTHDDPYRGGFTTKNYGRPDEGVHVIQLELSRHLYMDENTLMRGERFLEIQSLCSDLVARLAQFTPHPRG